MVHVLHSVSPPSDPFHPWRHFNLRPVICTSFARPTIHQLHQPTTQQRRTMQQQCTCCCWWWCKLLFVHWWTNVEWWCFFLTSSLPPRLLNCYPKVLSWWRCIALQCAGPRVVCWLDGGVMKEETGFSFIIIICPVKAQEGRDKRRETANARDLQMHRSWWRRPRRWWWYVCSL